MIEAIAFADCDASVKSAVRARVREESAFDD